MIFFKKFCVRYIISSSYISFSIFSNNSKDEILLVIIFWFFPRSGLTKEWSQVDKQYTNYSFFLLRVWFLNTIYTKQENLPEGVSSDLLKVDLTSFTFLPHHIKSDEGLFWKSRVSYSFNVRANIIMLVY